MDNTASLLCKACHKQGTVTLVTAHANCSSCHQPHTSPSGPYLLTGKTVTDTCTTSSCHGAQASEPRLNIASDISKISHHDTGGRRRNLANHIPDNTDCTDCHAPPTLATPRPPARPTISPRFGKIGGISAQGTAISPAQYEYQVCFKCHADRATSLITAIPRRIMQQNKRLQFAPEAISFHPVEVAGKNNYVPSLLPGMTASSQLRSIARTAMHPIPARRAMEQVRAGRMAQ